VIACELGLNRRRTVHKYARAASWQEVVRRPRLRLPTALSPYLDYRRQRRDESEHNAKILHQEPGFKGYRGHYQRVKVVAASWRETNGTPPSGPSTLIPPGRPMGHRPPEPRHVDAQERLRLLFAQCPELAHVHELVREFAAMLDQYDASEPPGRSRAGNRNHLQLRDERRLRH
jgi:hypothetical protein